ncbi:MAG: segregation/condensation protein A [Moraxellaceae bacterium]|nr:MAG: segregation/condensation protein A [Moraxellaceae bacterium]
MARMRDEWFLHVPQDLYIPPEAFKILLDYFEGPLDFLLYLVHKNGLDLLNLDIAPIATQYLHYIQQMRAVNIELAADYLVMAASLADIKSRLLLPQPKLATPEDDPRQNLLARLQQYAGIKKAANWLDACQILERDVFAAHSMIPAPSQPDVEDEFPAQWLQDAMQLLLQRPRLSSHQIAIEPVQLQERIEAVRQAARFGLPLRFDQLLNPAQGHMGIVVTFMAVLELLRQGELEIIASGLQQPLTLQGVMTHAA